MTNELVDCEKVVVQRLDGLSEIRFVIAEEFLPAGTVEWQDGMQATHTGATRNGFLIFEEIEVEKITLFA